MSFPEKIMNSASFVSDRKWGSLPWLQPLSHSVNWWWWLMFFIMSFCRRFSYWNCLALVLENVLFWYILICFNCFWFRSDQSPRGWVGGGVGEGSKQDGQERKAEVEMVIEEDQRPELIYRCSDGRCGAVWCNSRGGRRWGEKDLLWRQSGYKYGLKQRMGTYSQHLD